MASNLQVRLLGALVKVSVLGGEDGKTPVLVQNGFKASTDKDGDPVMVPNFEPQTRLVNLHRGDPKPDNLALGEEERLAKLDEGRGVFASPEVVAIQGRRQLEGETAGLLVDGGDAPVTDAFDVEKLAGYTDADLAAGLPGIGAKKIVDAVGDDKELAARVIAAENASAGGEARKSLVRPLQKLVDGGDA